MERSIRDLALRPTMRGLAGFMKNMYKKSIPAEEEALRNAASMTIEGGDQKYDATVFVDINSIEQAAIKKKISIFGALAVGKTSLTRRFVDNAREVGLLVHGCLIIGNPGETKETVEISLEE